MRAPLVMVLAEPGVHRAWSEAGADGQRHEKLPASGAEMLLTSSAKVAGIVTPGAGTKLRGRYPSWARICWRRTIDPGATLKWYVADAVEAVVVATPSVVTPRTETGRPKSTVTLAPGPKPKPVGVNNRLSGPGCDHEPATAGETVGRAVPKTWATGWAKVRLI